MSFKKICLLVMFVFLFSGCSSKEEEEIVLDGTYKCVYNGSGIEYTMNYTFKDSKLSVFSSNRSTVVNYTLEGTKIDTLNVVSGNKITGEVKKDKIIFVEEDSDTSFTCSK